MRYDNIIPFAYQRYAIKIPSIYLRYTNKMTTNTLSVLYIPVKNKSGRRKITITLILTAHKIRKQLHYCDIKKSSLRITLPLKLHLYKFLRMAPPSSFPVSCICENKGSSIYERRLNVLRINKMLTSSLRDDIQLSSQRRFYTSSLKYDSHKMLRKRNVNVVFKRQRSNRIIDPNFNHLSK